jgi:hypothetical protein
METRQQAPRPVREEEEMEQAALPIPEDERPPSEWAERAVRALEARELARKLRSGKRVLFPSMRSQSSR